MTEAQIKLKRTESVLLERIPAALSSLGDARLHALDIIDVKCSRGRSDAKVFIHPSSYTQQEKNEFIKLLKEEFPNLKKIVVGFDFCFGKDRKYCIEKLKELFDGEVLVIDEIKIDNIPVHSRIIRDYLKTGDIKMANKLLGKEYKIYGQKIVGQGLGAKSFVPTINLKVDEFLLPNEGVYITKTILDEQEFDSITFLGHRFTTDGSYAVETHILNKDIENKDYKTQIKFCEKIRDNKKFDTFEELKNQIINDIKSANNYFINIY